MAERERKALKEGEGKIGREAERERGGREIGGREREGGRQREREGGEE